jgi:hypothetical protein
VNIGRERAAEAQAIRAGLFLNDAPLPLAPGLRFVQVAD